LANLGVEWFHIECYHGYFSHPRQSSGIMRQNAKSFRFFNLAFCVQNLL